MQAASDGFTSHMIKADKSEEGRDRHRARETAGEKKKAREQCETPERGMGDGESTMM